MEHIFSKFSLYDFITTVVVGGIVYYGIYINGWLQTLCLDGYIYNTTYYWVVVWACYILGLVLHKIVESFDLSGCLNMYNKPHELCCFQRFFMSMFKRNYPPIIFRSRNHNSKIWGIKDNPFSVGDLLREYYIAYFKSIEKCANVGKLEAHSAFLRDVFFAFLIFIPKLKDYHNCCLWGTYAILLIFIWLARYRCEYKISYLIWERYAYDTQSIKNNKNKRKIGNDENKTTL